MIITSTPNVEGREIETYFGLVFGEVVSGVDIVKDLKASWINIVGGRSKSYEAEFLFARQEAIELMVKKAEALGAEAVVAVKIDYETIAGMFVVIANGTAVKLKP